jgi:putative phosphoserine phosphatase/1-acylglycerol-3-phosphate O-acyltransferase
MTGAAFFDLDRTLLPKGSGGTLAKHLEAEGVGSAHKIPGAELFAMLYEQFGETRLSMAATRQFVRTAKGWPVGAVQRAAENAALEMSDAVPRYATLLLDELRASGVKLVLATTTPTVLIGALADELGFDDVIATKWAHEDGKFVGVTDGPFVWGTEKRDAVVAWAEANNVDLDESSAYSDSYFDAPMLDVVGTAVAVNPDAKLAAVAALHGWEIRHFDAPPGVLKVLGRELQDLLRPLARTELLPAIDWDISGVEHIPTDGSAILAFNHRSYFDTFAMQILIARTGRPCRFLAKREMFDTPVLGTIARLSGGIPVDRGTGSTTPLRNANEALVAGEMVAIAPQGTIPRGPDFFDPVLKGRPGAAQLAIDSKTQVIPVGLWGTEVVWPRNKKAPIFDPRLRPRVSVTVGPAVELKRRKATTDTVRIMTAISELLPAEAREQREPTEADLARTYPAGKAP